MVKRALLLATAVVTTCGLLTGPARGDGFGVSGPASGVGLDGSPYRYVALSPSSAPRITVVERIEADRGKIDRWWYLPGDYYVPAVAYDRSAGGLSADGRTLVLTQFTRAFPPRRTQFALLRTDLYLSHPLRPGQHRPRHAIRRLVLDGSYSFDAISPDGSKIYLIHNLFSHGRPGRYEVRALDAASGRLLRHPIVDPGESDEQMRGLPITRAASPDGRWAYTLYDGGGKEPFVHALDTLRGQAVCIDLPQLESIRNLFALRLRLDGGGRRLVVWGRPTGGMPRDLVTVDTRTFAVEHSHPAKATASGDGAPWLPIGIAAAVLAAALIGILARRERIGNRPQLGRDGVGTP